MSRNPPIPPWHKELTLQPRRLMRAPWQINVKNYLRRARTDPHWLKRGFEILMCWLFSFHIQQDIRKTLAGFHFCGWFLFLSSAFDEPLTPRSSKNLVLRHNKSKRPEGPHSAEKGCWLFLATPPFFENLQKIAGVSHIIFRWPYTVKMNFRKSHGAI